MQAAHAGGQPRHCAARQRRATKRQRRRQQHSSKAARIKHRARAQAQRIDRRAGQKQRRRQRKVFHIHAYKAADHDGGLCHGQRTQSFLPVFAKGYAVGAQHIGKKDDDDRNGGKPGRYDFGKAQGDQSIAQRARIEQN